MSLQVFKAKYNSVQIVAVKQLREGEPTEMRWTLCFYISLAYLVGVLLPCKAEQNMLLLVFLQQDMGQGI